MENIIKRDWFIHRRNKLFITGLVLTLFLNVSICYLYHNFYSVSMADDTNWKQESEEYIAETEMSLEDEGIDEDTKDAIKRDIAVEKYRLEHDIPPNSWKTEYVIRDYLYKMTNQEDSARQKAIEQAMETDDWKIYYRYLDSTYKKTIETSEEKSEVLDAMVGLESNQLLYKYDIIPEILSDHYQDWRNEVYYQYQNNLNILLGAELMEGDSKDYYLTDAMKKDLEKKQEILLYRLEHNIPANRDHGDADNIHNAQIVRYVVYIILILLFSQIFAQEFDQKTIQQVLFLPYKREKIFISKFIVLLQIACVYMILNFLVSILSVHIFSGEMIYDQLIVLNHSIFSMNYYLYIFIEYILGILDLFFIITVMSWFTICGFGASFVSIMGVVCCFLRFFLIYAANQFHLFFLKYIPLLWLDWQQYLEASPCIPGLSMSMGIIGSLLLFGLFFASSLFMFIHKDL